MESTPKKKIKFNEVPAMSEINKIIKDHKRLVRRVEALEALLKDMVIYED